MIPARIPVLIISLVATSLSGTASVGEEAQSPPKTQPSSDALVTYERVELNLAGAERIIAAARQKAAAAGFKMNIAVVDDGGHLLAL